MFGGWRALIAAWIVVLGGLAGLTIYAFSGPAPERSAAAPQSPEAVDTTTPTADVSGLAAAPEETPEPPAWQRYGVAVEPKEDHPRIAVIVTGLGLSRSATEAAIDQLPAAVTLSFSPYAEGLADWIAQARADGHEVMLDLPMEAAAYASVDPGPQALLSGLSPEENLERLRWIAERGEGYVGLAAIRGAPLAVLPALMQPILGEVQALGLVYVHSGEHDNSVVPQVAHGIGLPHAINLRDLDSDDASAVVIEARLAQLERLALTEGRAVAMARPLPVTFAALSKWAGEVPARGFELLPITAVVDAPAGESGDAQSAGAQ